MMYSTAYNLWTFTWFVHFELPFRLKGTDKIHTERLSKFHSNIYFHLFENNPPSTRPWLHLYLILVWFIKFSSYYETILARRHFEFLLSELLASRVLMIDCIKVFKQGKLIAVANTLRTYWNQFSLGGICKQE